MNKLLIPVILFIICVIADDLQVKVALPEYICAKNGNLEEFNKDLTTLRLLNSQNQSYKFNVNFRRIGKNNCFNPQRCTLIIWRQIREFNLFLNTYPDLNSGLVEINNTMLMPGIEYIITISDNRTETTVNLKFIDEDARKSIKKPMASLLLLTSEFSYAFTDFLVKAEATICSNITDFQYSWTISDEKLENKGSELLIPSFTLQALQTYHIRCDLINMGNQEIIASSDWNLPILQRGLSLNLPFKTVTIAVNHPLQIEAFIENLDNFGEVSVKWTTDCKGTSENYEFTVICTNEGSFKLGVEIEKNGEKLMENAEIIVKTNIPSIEIDRYKNPINPSDGVTITAKIYELHSFCTLQWQSLAGENYSFLDLSTITENPTEITNITLKEDLFLNELEEYNNGTIDRDYKLIIPKNVFTGNDSKYLFQLMIKCPNSPQTLATVEIITNSPPILKNPTISPTQGVAFTTKFNIKTARAQDKAGDEPFIYKFGYNLGLKQIIFANLYQITNTEHILPYSENGIVTFLEGCDNSGSCTRVSGPKIYTTLPEFKENICLFFQEKLNCQEYYQAFSYGFSVLFSYKNNETIQRLIIEKTEEEIDKFLNNQIGNENTANDLIKNIVELDVKLPENILNKLIELRNKYENPKSEKLQTRKLLSIQESSLKEIKQYIDLSEMIIKSLNNTEKINEEKENLRKKLENFLDKSCNENYQIQSKHIILSVEKLGKTSFNYYQTIPFDGNPWKINGKINLNQQNFREDYRCVVKAIFRDFFRLKGDFFMVKLLPVEEVRYNFTILLPLVNLSNFKCVNYHKGDCKTLKIAENYVKCSCKDLGYFHLEYVEISKKPLKIKENTNLLQEILPISIIVASLIGILFLCVILKRILIESVPENEFPQYAQFYNEENFM